MEKLSEQRAINSPRRRASTISSSCHVMHPRQLHFNNFIKKGLLLILLKFDTIFSYFLQKKNCTWLAPQVEEQRIVYKLWDDKYMQKVDCDARREKKFKSLSFIISFLQKILPVYLLLIFSLIFKIMSKRL